MCLFPPDFGWHLSLNIQWFLPLREESLHLGRFLRGRGLPCLPEQELTGHSELAGNTVVRRTEIETVRDTLQNKHSEIKSVATLPFFSFHKEDLLL